MQKVYVTAENTIPLFVGLSSANQFSLLHHEILSFRGFKRLSRKPCTLSFFSFIHHLKYFERSEAQMRLADRRMRRRDYLPDSIAFDVFGYRGFRCNTPCS